MARLRKARAGRAVIRLEESGNHGARVIVRYADGRRRVRWVPPGSGVRVGIAAAVLGTNVMKLYRLMGSGGLKAVKQHGRWLVPLAELRRLRGLGRRGALADRRRRQ